MSFPTRILGLALAALAVAAGTAAADIVHLKTGTVEGAILEQTATELVVKTSAGTVRLKLSDVVRVEKKASPLDVYREMAAKVKDDDADGHFALGLWCTDHKLYGDARQEFQRAIAIDPNHKGAREKLGYVLKDGNWLTYAEARQAEGFVRHKGEWVPTEKRDDAERREEVLAWRRRFLRAIAARPTTREAIAERIHQAIGERPRDVASAALELILREMTKEAFEAKRDRTVDTRLALVDLLSDPGSPDATDVLRDTALRDIDAKVRAAAVQALKAQASIGNTAYFVSVLRQFTSSRVRANSNKAVRSLARRALRRAAQALGELGDVHAVPALARAMIVRFHIQQKGGDLPPMSIGMTSSAMVGGNIISEGGDQFVMPVTETSNWGLEGDKPRSETDELFFFNEAAYNALRDLTGQDFAHDQDAWLAWWYRNRHEVVD